MATVTGRSVFHTKRQWNLATLTGMVARRSLLCFRLGQRDQKCLVLCNEGLLRPQHPFRPCSQSNGTLKNVQTICSDFGETSLAASSKHWLLFCLEWVGRAHRLIQLSFGVTKGGFRTQGVGRVLRRSGLRVRSRSCFFETHGQLEIAKLFRERTRRHRSDRGRWGGNLARLALLDDSNSVGQLTAVNRNGLFRLW
jgi:hypothetical protein